MEFKATRGAGGLSDRLPSKFGGIASQACGAEARSAMQSGVTSTYPEYCLLGNLLFQPVATGI